MMKTKRSETTKEVKDTSPIIPQRDKIKNLLSIHQRQLNEKQKQFLELAMDKSTKIVFVSGPAGTSKTYMAIYAALTLLNQRRVSDLIYIRSAVESSEAKLGFLPGEAEDKMAPYLAPLLDKLIELLPKGDIDYLKKDGRVSSIPVGFLRGLNWNTKVIISDEAQNMTFKELFTLITRTGEFSKVFILGDPEQSDINGKSGFVRMMSYFDDEESKANGIQVFKFTDDDIVRSGLVQFIIKKVRKTV
jgi:phosphate starvation-inducible PhoH-like protein